MSSIHVSALHCPYVYVNLLIHFSLVSLLQQVETMEVPSLLLRPSETATTCDIRSGAIRNEQRYTTVEQTYNLIYVEKTMQRQHPCFKLTVTVPSS